MTGLILPPGQGRKLITKAQEVTFKATQEHGSAISIFEVVVPPGFDVGAHVHADSQEFFYVLEGELQLLAFEPTRRTEKDWHEWESPDGDKAVRATEGACMFVPSGTPDHFNGGDTFSPSRVNRCGMAPPSGNDGLLSVSGIFNSFPKCWHHHPAGATAAALSRRVTSSSVVCSKST